MGILIAGLAVFLGAHSVRMYADPWRTSVIARWGARRWRAVYAIASLAGFVLIVRGYGLAGQNSDVLWSPPGWMPHLTGLLVVIAFVLVAAAYVPRNAIKARLHHPMVLGVKLWAFAHLLANGTLAAGVLFGCFLLWSALSFRAARRRDLAAGTVYTAGTGAGTATAIVAGIAAWAVFAFWLHGLLIGVSPFG
jgi:uncharacterized membrane protein